MAELAPDVLEKILIGFDVKELIRFKRVCKSWYSFISSSRFIKSHLKHNDVTDNNIGHRRILSSLFGKHVVGSCNGLVCISPFPAKVLVANPMTIEVNKLPNPVFPPNVNPSSLCWGFGYDLVSDDYKVIVGYLKGNHKTCFQVLSLKTNVWKVIGDVKYSFVSNVGVLCNGVLHWFMGSRNGKKKVILSFHLSDEEFKEIMQPDDVRYEYTSDSSLGIINECLCIFRPVERRCNKWVMQNYNLKESWALLPYDSDMKYDIAHYLGLVLPRFFYCKEDIGWYRSGEYIGAPVFVKSLVSPHVNGTPKKNRSVKVGLNYHVISWSLRVPYSMPKRKRLAKEDQRNAKLIKRDPSAPGQSAKA